MFESFCFAGGWLLMWCGVVVLVLLLRGCWFGGMIGRIRLVGGRVMREGEAKSVMCSWPRKTQ